MGIDALGLAFVFWKGLLAFLSTSVVFLVIKVFLFVYVVVLFADIVMLLMLKGVSNDLKNTLYGTKRLILSKSKAIVRWEKVLARLKDDNPSQYKVAILEADAFAEEIFAGMGYAGDTMAEKLNATHEGQIGTKDLLVEAHKIRNRIIHETDFSLSREEALKWIGNYRAFFDEMELF